MTQPFAATPLFHSSQLPFTVISLNDWVCVSVQGPDAARYMQGQVTADVNTLASDAHVLCGHCDAKGKMWSNLRLFHYADGLGYVLRRATLEQQLSELKKYAVFSKVTIKAEPDLCLLGFAGTNARQCLTPFFTSLPDAENQVISNAQGTLLYLPFPTERFLWITDEQNRDNMYSLIGTTALYLSAEQWLALEIEAGYAVIDPINAAAHLPQACNTQLFNGISFTKGCYTGQEMVARAKYRGANKRALYLLSGHSSALPQAGEDIELQLEQHWKRTGCVLAAVKLADNRVLIQVILNNDLQDDAVLRVREDHDSLLNIIPFPYSLDD